MAKDLRPEDFHVGWLCAVPTEYVVACELLDEEFTALPVNSAHDNNTYTFGRLSQHNVVIACLPKGKYGLTSAASVAKDMLRSFPSIRLGLMVGIAGGAPSQKHDIRLGDVVVSSPIGRMGGVIHYEFGKTIQNQRLERTGALDAPPTVLLTALNSISARHERKGHRIAETVQAMVDRNTRLRKKYGRPDAGMDRLYKSTFVHPDHEQSCEEMCKKEASRLVHRNERATDEDDPVIHYGMIASADRLMKDAKIRDTLAREEDVLCFEMEAAGLMDNFPCVVIRGICDYSDTHKNDRWQGYAAATAAAYAKELLEVIQPIEMGHLSPATSRSGQTESTLENVKGVRSNSYGKVPKQLAKQPKEEESAQFAYSGTGAQINQTGRGTQNVVSGNQYTAGTQYFGREQAFTADDIDQACLHALRCSDSLVVKNRLKENKDKLLHKSIEWIFNDDQYNSWQNEDDVSLLWIKGGAGKGKTMMSIGLIEELSRRPKPMTVVTYFFCQNADYELNTITAIIKGLIRRLVGQQQELMKSLRDRWDTVNKRFIDDVTSWRGLWDIFMEMLDRCKCSRLYVVVDALDECLQDGVADLLKLIVRSGLDHPSRIKWLLTSRPLDVAEEELMAGSDQVMVSLELNSKHISQGVAIYISYKVTELARRYRYGLKLRQDIEKELVLKAEDTFLWVSLVCKELEKADSNQVLKTIRGLPPGLPSYYRRILSQLCIGEMSIVTGSVRLLKVMMLTYRPLNVSEVSSVTGLSKEELAPEALVNRCASFIKMGGKDLEFVHQSARDYLAGVDGQSVLDSHDRYGHSEIAMSCLSYLSRQLKVNLLHLPRPDFTTEKAKVIKGDSASEVLTSLDYAATLWVRHIVIAKHTTLVQNALADDGIISKFLSASLVEWLECLSLLEKLPRALEALQTLKNILDPSVKCGEEENLNKVPKWFMDIPQVEIVWTSLIQTLVGHSNWVMAVAFSPDGQQIASGSDDNTIKLWDATTGDLQKTLAGHSGGVRAVAFSPDGHQIASGSEDYTVKLWDATTGDLQKTLAGHSGGVRAVAFSPDGHQIASGSWDKTVKLWDATTGDLQKTLAGHSGGVAAVAFSPDGQQIASGSWDKTVKLWDATTGDLQKTLAGHPGGVMAVAFSPDGQQIASGSWDDTVKLWDATTGDLQKTLAGHSSWVRAVAFSPDGQQIASGSGDYTVKLWDATTGDLQKTLAGHSDGVTAVAFSPNGQQIASGSWDDTVKLWDATTGDLQKTLAGHSGGVRAVAFSPDGQQIASGSWDKTVKLWDAPTGDLQKTLAGHSGGVRAVAFSPDGQQIASGSWDYTVKLWDATTSDLQKTLAGHSDGVTAVAFSPDGQQIASGSGDYTVKLWDATTGDLQKTLAGHSGGVRAVAFSPDGHQIASGSWDNTVKLWDATTGDLQKTLAGHSGGVMAVAFSPDGQQIASGSEDNTVKLWDATTGDLQKTLAGHSDGVTAVAFSPDGHQIASGSWDNTVKLWDVAKYLKFSNWRRSTFNRLIKLRTWQSIEIPKQVSSLKFSSDNRYLETNIGNIKITKIITDGRTARVESFEGLHVSDQWIHDGAVRVLRLPADFQACSHDVRDNQVTIGFENGRVLRFKIDRERLLAELDGGFKQSLT